MHTRNYTVQELLDIPSLWSRKGDHFEVLYSYDGGRGTQQVTDAELAQRHPNLALALNAWCENNHVGLTIPHTTNSSLRNMLRLWENPLVLIDTEGEEFKLAHIDLVKDAYDDIVVLEATRIRIDYAGDVPYVSGTDDVHVVIESSKLEEKFPGWLARYRVFQGLDCEDEMLDSFVFSTTPKPAFGSLPVPTSLA